MTTMDKVVIQYIESHIDLIDTNNWEEFYQNFSGTTVRVPLKEYGGRITDVLLAAGIDPLAYLDYIPDSYLAGAHQLEFEIPTHIQKLGWRAFMNSSIQMLTIPDGIPAIPYKCFDSCYNLQTVVIPDSVTFIDPFAFSNDMTFSITCHAGSYAHMWAQKNQVQVVLSDA